jgi:hypothetical protein
VQNVREEAQIDLNVASCRRAMVNDHLNTIVPSATISVDSRKQQGPHQLEIRWNPESGRFEIRVWMGGSDGVCMGAPIWGTARALA